MRSRRQENAVKYVVFRRRGMRTARRPGRARWWSLVAFVACTNVRASLAQDKNVMLSEQMELARLVDIAAQRLKVNIEYDATLLKGSVTLRLGAGISDAELWDLTNRLLAARGFTTVMPPGRDGVLSVVR